MRITSSFIKSILSAALSSALLVSALQVHAGPHEPAQTPLFASQSAAPLNMLVLGRDHTLYSPAYDNASDLNGDGVIDVGYKGHLSKDQGGLDYFGYFDSYKCYSYGSNVFTPNSVTQDKTCGGSLWSGDYLNYLTTSRMDALRKVLYGGYRSTDSAASKNSSSKTILERVYIRNDAHTWGSEYTNQATDGYNIKNYTPFDAPTRNGRRILFASTNKSSTEPVLRIRQNTNNRIWDWVAAESVQAKFENGDTDYIARVEVCVENEALREGEDNCTQYEGRNYKPTGLLHDFGESDDMYFGLLTGSYTNNLQGGVLRKAIGSFRDEIDVKTGVFNKSTAGIVKTLNELRISHLGTNNYPNCTTGNTLANGSCPDWGNPLGEMMFEALRYLSGNTSPTSSYSYTDGNDGGLTLPKASWSDPYAEGAFGAQCSRPFMTVISDVNPSYDSALPGNSFGESTPSGLSGLNVSTLGQTIWNQEIGGSANINIGQSGNTASDHAPTAKTANSFGNIRGLPDEPTRQGTYNSASVAYYANTHPLTSRGSQRVKTYAVALSSPLPQIRMPVGDSEITLVPFGKVVTGNPDVTMQITGFFVDSMENMRGQPSNTNINEGRPQASFRVVFDDAAQGADYDMDIVVLYEARVTANQQLEVKLTRTYANAGYQSHIGYTLAGAGNADGIYLEVSGGNNNNYQRYIHDTQPGRSPGDCNPTSKNTCRDNNPLVRTDGVTTQARLFSPGAGSTTRLENPLWYAAKWGGFGDFDNATSSKPVDGQWDSKLAGTPDNYFLVTNAGTLQAQLTAAFRSLANSVGSVTSPAVKPDGNTASDSEFSVYRTDYQVSNWSGNLLKETINTTTGEREEHWDATSQMKSSRNIKMPNADGDGLIDFSWTGLNTRPHLQQALAYNPKTNEPPVLNNGSLSSADEALGKKHLSQAAGSRLRDIINSSPIVVEGAQYLHYLANKIEPNSDYGAFATSPPISTRTPLVYVGSNGGMLHAFSAATGEEKFAFVPTAVIPKLYRLSSPDYSQAGGEHQYFVDGTPVVRDVYFDNAWHTVLIGTLRAGGRALFALDITNAEDIKLLWEFNVGDDLAKNETGASDLGYSFPTPSIARLHSGQWAVVTGNGYDSEGKRAALLLIDIENGELIKKLPVGTAPDFSNENDINGLSSVRVADNNSDGIADYVYAGDLQGNLWRFDLINTNDDTPLTPTGTVVPDHFSVSFGGDPLYSAKNASGERQPITAPPSLVRHPSMEGYIVMFGTGRYFQDTDKATDRLDSVYGIWDKQTLGKPAPTTPNLARSSLIKQSFIEEKPMTFSNGDTSTTAVIRTLSNNDIDWTQKYGWVLDLTESNGERVIDEMAARGQVLFLTSRTPVDNDPCSPGLQGWTYGINPYSGGRTTFNVFDFNQSGKVGEDDSDNGGVISGFQTPAGGLTLSGDTLFATDGSTIKIDYGTTSTGRQSWQVIPEND